MNIKDYISIARPNHWFKNIFILPGVLFAAFLTHVPLKSFLPALIMGLISTCLISSANYVINEWLDARYDKFHPTKNQRPSVLNKVKPHFVLFEYLCLSLVALILAYKISNYFFITSLLFFLMGIIYNIRPFRTKEIVYLDVLSEALNNPIRLLLGWFIVTSHPLPPSSLLIGYWMGGAYLMGIKRYAEYRFIASSEQASLYRSSFKTYTEDSLLISSFFYAVSSAFFLGVFLVKYRVELLLSLPCFAMLFAWYLKIGLQKDSPAQTPEKLFAQKGFTVFVILICTIVWILLRYDIPALNWFLSNAFVK